MHCIALEFLLPFEKGFFCSPWAFPGVEIRCYAIVRIERHVNAATNMNLFNIIVRAVLLAGDVHISCHGRSHGLPCS